MFNRIFIPYTILTVTVICILSFFMLTPIFDYTWLMLTGQNTHWWTLITYQYLHASVKHIVSNLLVLLCFGALIEKHIGAIRTLFLITISGIISSSWWLLTHANPSDYMVGISGATYTLVSVCFLYVFPKKRRFIFYWQLAAVFTLALIQPIIGIFDGSAWEVHVMGIFVGAVYGMYLTLRSARQL